MPRIIFISGVFSLILFLTVACDSASNKTDTPIYPGSTKDSVMDEKKSDVPAPDDLGANIPAANTPDNTKENDPSFAYENNLQAEIGLKNVRQIASDYLAPVLSPDGSKVALTKPGYLGLYILDIETKAISTLSKASRSGYKPLWHPLSKRIAYRVPGQKAHEAPMLTVNLDKSEGKPFATHKNIWVKQQDDKIFLTRDNNTTEISKSGDRYFAPIISDDESFIVYNGLKKGVYLYSVEDKFTTLLGSGNNPSFDPSGKYLVFDKTTDNGQELTGGDLYIVELKHEPYTAKRLTNTKNRIETQPSMAAGKIVFAADENILIAEISVK